MISGRISIQVFKGIAKRGKTTKGWFYGFRLHIVINEFGQLLSFMLTPGNNSNLNALPSLAETIFGKLFGDKGYLSQEMFDKLLSRGIQLITRLRARMKNKLMPVIDKVVLRKRGMIDSVIQQLKGIAQIEHSLHRSPCHFIVNLLRGLISSCLCPDKPSIRLEKSKIKLLKTQAI